MTDVPGPGADPTPGADRARDTEPARVRALAHPLRLRLLDLLDADGPLTATECARATGESVPSCAFHLQTLAKYGYVEPAERRGREKPWRSVARRDGRYDPAQEGSLRAVSELARLTVAREADRLQAWLDRSAAEDDEWLLAAGLTLSSFWATPAELREVREALEHLTDRFAGRSDDRALRPAGARRARLFAAVNADAADAHPGDGHPADAHPGDADAARG